MVESNSRKAYFAAANSGKGFVSMFDEIFFGENIKRLYIIKGGPGTGKSSFIRKVGLFAERKGLSVEYYYCSSDTDSLDGAVIGGSVALFDGTAPHSYDTVAPGVRDEIVNLGQFWDGEKLRRHAEKIAALGKLKGAAYRRAYGYLSAALATVKTADDLVRDCVLTEKMKSAAARDLSKLGLTQKGSVATAQTEAMGVRGRVYLPTLAVSAKRLHIVEDCYGIASAYLGELLELARLRDFEAKVSFDTVDTSKVREILFPETGDCFTAVYEDEREDCPRVNVKRFIDTEKYAAVRQTYRSAMNCYDKLCRLAMESLVAAGKAHGEMEKYYVAAMDFTSEEKYLAQFLDKLSVL